MKTDKIIIVGGGSAGWMTAATLIRSFPNKEISVIESPDHPIVGVGESTLGSINKWTRYLGIEEKSFIPLTDASLKMSIKFTDFYRKDSGSFHYPFGRPFRYSDDESPILDWHILKYYYPDLPISSMVDYIFPAAHLFNKNKISYNHHGKFNNYDYDSDVAYHFDAIKFGQWLKNNYCLPRGVKIIKKSVVDVNIVESGIESLILNDGSLVKADLFVDCTGFQSLLLEKILKEPFVSYENILPNNRAWATRIEYKDKQKEIEPFTNCTAIQNGWCWNIPLWTRLGAGYVYSDKYVSPEKAKEEFKQYLMSDKMIIPRSKEEVESLDFRDIRMRVGIHQRTFVKNVVAIGLSAGFIEPLESNGLFSVHEFLFVLIDTLQREFVNEFDREIYNIKTRDMFDGFARFVGLHYALSHRDDTPYWQDIQQKRFNDFENLEYSPYTNRVLGFHEYKLRYIDEWGGGKQHSGLSYIMAGMNVLNMNDCRINELEWGIGPEKISGKVEKIKDLWDRRSSEWKKAAENESTLYNFLKENFYE